MSTTTIIPNHSNKEESKEDKLPKLLKSQHTLGADGVQRISIDTTPVTYNALQNVVASEKGNKTVLYEKWTDHGITYQLTGYITSTNLEAIEQTEKTLRMKQQAKENEALKAQLAQFQTLMSNPEMQALMKKLTENK